MIALPLPFRLPSIQVGTQEIPHDNYDQNWLASSIHIAAQEAGHDKWWFADDIAKSVFLYLRNRFQGKSITLPEVFTKASFALEAIGFCEIAEKLKVNAPPVQISLLDIVREAGDGYELLFFQILRNRIDDLNSAGTPAISLTGLNPCVRQLCTTDVWIKGCDDLQHEIIDFAAEALKNCAGRTFKTPALLIR